MGRRHKGDFHCVPAMGRPVRVWGVVIDRLVDRRIKDTRFLRAYGVGAAPTSG
jgi:hypothetical protein